MTGIAQLLSMAKSHDIDFKALERHIEFGLEQGGAVNPDVTVKEIRDKEKQRKIIGSSIHVSAELEGEEISFQFQHFHKAGVADVRRSVNISSERIVAMLPDEVHAGFSDTVYNGNINYYTHPNDMRRRELAENLDAKTSEIATHIQNSLEAPAGDPFNAAPENSLETRVEEPFMVKRGAVKQIVHDLVF